MCGKNISSDHDFAVKKADGILRLWDKAWLRAAGTVALLAVAITYHGVYNILVSQTGILALVGYLIPLFTTVLTLIFRKTVFGKVTSEE